MTEKDLFYMLALQKASSVGAVKAKKLLNHFGTASNIFKAKKNELLRIEGIGTYLANSILDDSLFNKATQELSYIQKNNIQVYSFNEDNYPTNLKHCIDSPILLFARGKLDPPFTNRKIISVVGTRKITSQGISFCNKLIEELSVFNPIVVSGFAYGADITAHKAALKNNLETIGCFAHGFEHIYPKAHERYLEAIERKGGFITDFWSDEMPERKHFLRRNRIIAGMAHATIVIESANKGGSLVTADIAVSYNRELFAVPGRVTDVFSEGCNSLIKIQKAHMLTAAADLVYIMGWEVAPKPKKPIQKTLFTSLTSQEEIVYHYLQQKDKEAIDTIALECNIPIHRLHALLMSLEMKGLIKPLPGKMVTWFS